MLPTLLLKLPPVQLRPTLGQAPCPRFGFWVATTPALAVLCYSVLLALKRTRPFALATLQENGPVELLTFALLLVAGVVGAQLSVACWRRRERGWVTGFYAVFAFGLVLTAMEEVAWGQWFFHFATPKLVQSINRQGELTLHNLKGVHEHLAQLNFVFGLGGLIGILAGSWRPLEKIGAPRILCLWFLVETLLATADEWVHALPLHNRFDKSVQRLAELNELLIAGSAWLYMLFNRRRLASLADRARQRARRNSPTASAPGWGDSEDRLSRGSLRFSRRALPVHRFSSWQLEPQPTITDPCRDWISPPALPGSAQTPNRTCP